MREFALMAALVLVLAPGTARADWLFTPSIGPSFGGSMNGREALTWGASIGWMGAGVFGWEADFSYTPEFFEAEDNDIDFFDTDNVTSFMFNGVLGVPIGGQLGPGFRPYAAAGLGLMQIRVEDASQLFDIDSNEFGFNVGGGAIGFFSDHVGLRGDIRYFRQITEADQEDSFDLDLGDLDFWRATAGVTFRW